MSKIKVLVWNEYKHEQTNELVREVYPDGIHNAIASYLRTHEDFEVTAATQFDPEQGLPDDLLNETDVLIWWSHATHHEVRDDIVEKVKNRILDGMGFIPLHSSHLSKIFISLMGTTCKLRWREAGEKERLWNLKPAHPITEGIGDYFELEKTEMYGEVFDIPDPDELIFVSWFAGGEVFRSGCTWYRGNGRVFYFRPGHETFPIYYNENVLKVIANGVRWAKPRIFKSACGDPAEPLEKI